MVTIRKSGSASGSIAFDRLKWLVVVSMVGVAVAGNWWFQEMSLLARVLGVVGLGVIATLVMLQTARGRELWEMAKEARSEVRRVVWPTRQETVSTTLIVLLTVLVFSLILWALDSLLSWVVRGFIG